MRSKNWTITVSVFLSTLQQTALLLKKFRLRLHCYTLVTAWRTRGDSNVTFLNTSAHTQISGIGFFETKLILCDLQDTIFDSFSCHPSPAWSPHFRLTRISRKGPVFPVVGPYKNCVSIFSIRLLHCPVSLVSGAVKSTGPNPRCGYPPLTCDRSVSSLSHDLPSHGYLRSQPFERVLGS